MRLIKYEEDETDREYVLEFMKENNIKSKWMYLFGTYFDTIGILNVDENEYFDMMDIYNLAEENGFIPIVDKIINLRNSLIRLARTDYFKDLKRSNYLYEDKVKTMLGVFQEILDKVAPELSRENNPGQSGNGDNKPNEGDGDGEGSQDSSWSQDPGSNSGDIDKLADAINSIGDVLDMSYSTPDEGLKSTPQTPEEILKSNNSSRGKVKNEPLRLAAKNVDILVQVTEWASLLKLVSKYRHFLKGKAHNLEVPSPIGQIKFRKMTSYNELKYVRKQDWMLPDDVFDAKLAKKNFTIERPVHRNKNFNLYVLADVSGSMNGLRMTFLLSMLMALGKQAKESGSKLTVVPFSSRPYPPIILTDWNKWINKILKLKTMDCTNMDRALVVAYANIVDEELLLITDATEDRFPENKPKGIDITALILSDSRDIDDKCLKTFKKNCSAVIINDTTSLKQAEKVGFQLLDIL